MSTTELALKHGGYNLLQLHEDGPTRPIVSKVAIGPLKVAAGILLEPEALVYVENNVFSCAHYVSRSRERKSEYFDYNQAPLFAVAVSANALNHPQVQFASTLVENLKTVRDPWIGLEHAARGILHKSLGFEHPPPVVTIVATETDFSQKDDFSHGVWVTVVEPGIRLGIVESRHNLVFVVVFGSKVWEKGYATYVPSQTYSVLQHELAHFLTLIALR